MPKELTSIYCPLCDRRESGHTQARLLNRQGGWSCTQGCKFPNYLALMAMKPRMDKLVIQEKQPPGSTSEPMWIHPEALSALRERFPSNFRTTIYSLFNALAGGALVLNADEYQELKDLGITKGREIVGLAKTNLELTEQLKLLSEQMKQYEMLSKLMAIAGGGKFNSPAEQAGTVAEILTSPADQPPQQPVLPIVDTESDVAYEPAAPGSFGIADLGPVIRPARAMPTGTLSALLKNPPPPR